MFGAAKVLPFYTDITTDYSLPELISGENSFLLTEAVVTNLDYMTSLLSKVKSCIQQLRGAGTGVFSLLLSILLSAYVVYHVQQCKLIEGRAV